MKIAWFDGGRHRRNSGYGHAARVLLLALLEKNFADIVLLGPQPSWENDDPRNQRLDSLEIVPSEEGCDFAIQVSTPEGSRNLSVPSALYTFLDVSGPTVGQESILKKNVFLIAPNTTMQSDYASRAIQSVLFQPSIDTTIFRPQPRWRDEGQDAPSFIFVGTHSFRKGTDILLRAFLKAFPDANAHLHLHIPGSAPDSLFNTTTALIRQFGHPANITLSTNYLSLPWLARYYARSDCFVTATRGEGWGIPPMEAMAAGLPLIAPYHGGLKDFAHRDSLFEITGENRKVSEISDGFGGNFKRKYDDGNSLSYFEPCLDSLVSSFHAVASISKENLVLRGLRGRAHIESTFSNERTEKQAQTIVEKISDYLRQN